MKVIIHKKDRVDYILNGVCDYYGITKGELCHYCKNPKKILRKKIAITLLRDVATCSFQDMLNVMNYKDVDALYFLYNSAKSAFDPNYYGNRDTIEEYLNVIKHLEL